MYSPDVAARIRNLLTNNPKVEELKMFSDIAFTKKNGKF